MADMMEAAELVFVRLYVIAIAVGGLLDSRWSANIAEQEVN